MLHFFIRILTIFCTSSKLLSTLLHCGYLLFKKIYFLQWQRKQEIPGIHLYTPCSNDVTQKGDGGAMELALLCFYKQLVLQKASENLSDVEHMFFGGAGEDEDVIEVDKDEPVHHVTENIINQSLEHSRGVGKAKWHDQILVVTAGCIEDSLPFVPFLYLHQVVGIP